MNTYEVIDGHNGFDHCPACQAVYQQKQTIDAAELCDDEETIRDLYKGGYTYGDPTKGRGIVPPYLNERINRNKL